MVIGCVNKRRTFEMIYKTDKINKILRLGLLMALIIMSSGIASADIMLNVPTFDQTDSRWASDPLGLGTCTETIGSSGCAVTSVAMVLKYYGIQTDPKDLNSFLKINAGYDNCKIYWPKGALRSSGTVIYIDPAPSPDLNRIRSELDNGFPVIAKVRLESEHWAVITGYSGSTFYINDPLGGQTNVDLTSRYSGTIHAIRLYHRGKVPISGDMNGDGIDTTGIFDAPAATFTIDGKSVNFAAFSDLPVIGDWDNDGKDEIGVFRPNENGQSKFYIITRDWSTLGSSAGSADYAIPFGYYPDNIPLAGDWDGDGDDDIAGYKPSTFTFYLYSLDLGSSSATRFRDVPFGVTGDIPISGDWDNDGDCDIGIFRPLVPNQNTNSFYLDLVSSQSSNVG